IRPARDATAHLGSPRRCNTTADRAVAPATPAPPCWLKSAPVPLGVRGPTFFPAQTVMHLQGGRQEQGRGCIGADPTFTASNIASIQPGDASDGAPPRSKRTTRAPSPG